MDISTDALLQEIEEYCQKAGIAESTFGRHAINDGKLCARLRSGKSVTLTTAKRVTEFIQNTQLPAETSSRVPSVQRVAKEIHASKQIARRSEAAR